MSSSTRRPGTRSTSQRKSADGHADGREREVAAAHAQHRRHVLDGWHRARRLHQLDEIGQKRHGAFEQLGAALRGSGGSSSGLGEMTWMLTARAPMRSAMCGEALEHLAVGGTLAGDVEVLRRPASRPGPSISQAKSCGICGVFESVDDLVQRGLVGQVGRGQVQLEAVRPDAVDRAQAIGELGGRRPRLQAAVLPQPLRCTVTYAFAQRRRTR